MIITSTIAVVLSVLSYRLARVPDGFFLPLPPLTSVLIRAKALLSSRSSFGAKVRIARVFFSSFLFSSCACALPALSLTPAPSRDARSSVSSQEPSVSYLQGRAVLGDGSALGVSLDP